jgi:hypothetical protein
MIRFAKIPDEPVMAAGGLVAVEQNSTSSSGSSSGSSSDSDDSEDERARKLLLLQEQVIVKDDSFNLRLCIRPMNIVWELYAPINYEHKHFKTNMLTGPISKLH